MSRFSAGCFMWGKVLLGAKEGRKSDFFLLNDAWIQGKRRVFFLAVEKPFKIPTVVSC